MSSVFERRLTIVRTVSNVTIPPVVERPPSGTSYYRLQATIFNGRGEMEDPDSDTVYFAVRDSGGSILATRLYEDNAGSTALVAQSGGTFDGFYIRNANLSTGRYEAFFSVPTGADEFHYTLEAGYTENSRDVFVPSVRFRVGDAADLDDIETDVNAILVDTADMQPKLGTPAGASISADIATIDGVVDAILVDTGTTLPATLGTPAGASISADIATVDANVDAILADTADMQPKLGTPAGASISADIATVDTVVDAILVDTGTTLPATLGTPAGASISADIATIDTEVGDIQTDLGDFSGNTNLQSLKAVLGEAAESLDVPAFDMLMLGMGEIYAVGGTPGAGTFTLTTLGDGSDVIAQADRYNSYIFRVVAGTNKGVTGFISDFSGAALVTWVDHAGATPTLSTDDIIAMSAAASVRHLLANPADLAGLSSGAQDDVFGALLAMIGDPTGDTLSTLTAKVGDSGDASTTDSIIGLIGDPTDAAVAADDGTEGSVFAKLRDISTDVGALSAASGLRRGNFTAKPYQHDTVVSGIAQEKEVAAGQTTSSTAEEVIDVQTIALPETTSGIIDHIEFSLKWTSDMDANTGNTRWYLIPVADTVNLGDDISTLTNAVAITDQLAASTTKTTHERSGTARTSAIPATNGFKLILAADVSVGTDTLTATIFDATYLPVEYHT